MKRVLRLTLLAGLLAAAASAQPAQAPIASDYQAVIDNPSDEDAFERLLAKLPQVRIRDGEVMRTFYVWEGDLPRNREQVRAAIFASQVGAAPARGSGELLLNTVAGRDDFWRRGQRDLTYAVDCASFRNPARCSNIKANMRAAASAWVGACSTACGLRMREVPMPAAGAAAPRFMVRYYPDPVGWIAMAFFPSEPSFRRQVLIGSTYFTTSFDKVGVLRHELGHVLGYRHEHIRGIAGCSFEDNDWKPLTPYDPHSVMHYFCGGGGSMTMALTPSDMSGHKALYSRP